MPSSHKKQTGGRKIWLPCGETSIFALNFTSSNSPVIIRAELSSLNSLKVWGEGQKPHHNIALLAGLGRRHHGGQTLWPLYCMGKLWSSQGCFCGGSGWETDCLHLQWDQLALCPSMAAWGHSPCTTPQGWALGHPTSERGRGGPLWLDQQLEVCQLLVASPQVIYPVGLNGHDEPIITSLPEPLASGVSLTTGESIYLDIDIPSSPVEEPDQKIPLLGEVSTIVVASPHKSPLKSEGSMTMKVSNLLSQAMLETSSCRSKHSSPRKPNPMVVPMTPSQKPEGPLWPVNTSSQESVEAAEASLEDIPAGISPIAAVSRTWKC